MTGFLPISVKIESLQYGQGAVITLPSNRESFEWELAKDGTLKELDQEVRVGQGKEAPRFEADFDVKPNQTVIRQEETEPKTRVVKPGLALVRVATAAGKLSIKFWTERIGAVSDGMPVRGFRPQS